MLATVTYIFIMPSKFFTNTCIGTWYNTGLGACGKTNNDTEFVVAVPFALYDAYPGATPNPNLNPICGKKIIATCLCILFIALAEQLTYICIVDGVKNVTVTVADKCWGCKGYDLDFTPAAFSKLADPLIGRIHGVNWKYL